MNATTNHQLNPYAIQLCTLSRWISAKQWAPAGSGNFSIRSAEQSCLMTTIGKDKGELNPHDLVQINWRNHETEFSSAVAKSVLLHVALYQRHPRAKVILQTQSVAANVWSRLIDADHYRFHDYELQSVITNPLNPSQRGNLVILDANQSSAQQAAEVTRRADELTSALLIRGHGLYVWGDSMEHTKQQLEAWEFLINCELEVLKINGLR